MEVYKAATVDVLLFGLIAESAGKRNLQVTGVYDLVDLLRHMETQYPFLKTIKFNIAVNKTKMNKNRRLKTGDQIAILPPFAGG